MGELYEVVCGRASRVGLHRVVYGLAHDDWRIMIGASGLAHQDWRIMIGLHDVAASLGGLMASAPSRREVGRPAGGQRAASGRPTGGQRAANGRPAGGQRAFIKEKRRALHGHKLRGCGF